MSDVFEDPKPAKRKDVGYCRPPAEHQFQLGQKPPARKKRTDYPMTVRQTLTKILGEGRRLKRGRKTRWYSKGYLVVEVAFRLAEEGNSAVSRALADYLMAGDPTSPLDDQPRIEYDPNGETGIRHYTIRRKV